MMDIIDRANFLPFITTGTNQIRPVPDLILKEEEMDKEQTRVIATEWL